jgi:hypothetical protein
MDKIKCMNCGCMIEAHKKITSGLKLPILVAFCNCGRLNMEYIDKFSLIPSNETTGILRFEKTINGLDNR